MDKRDEFTLTAELVNLKQSADAPIEFYQKIQKILNLLLSYFRNHKNQVEYGILSEHARGLALRTLLKGLPEPIGSILKAKNPMDLNTALSMLTNDFQYNLTTKQSIFHTQTHPTRPKTFHPQRPRKHVCCTAKLFCSPTTDSVTKVATIRISTQNTDYSTTNNISIYTIPTSTGTEPAITYPA